MRRRTLLTTALSVPVVGCTRSASTIAIEELAVVNRDSEPHTIGIVISSSEEIVFDELVEIDSARMEDGTRHIERTVLDAAVFRDDYFEITAIGPQATRWETPDVDHDVTLKLEVHIERDGRVIIWYSGARS